ncbi:MAG TPA: PCYCGC motif-containing (lipo)protein [Candidatus Limnocylindrales bacterium]
MSRLTSGTHRRTSIQALLLVVTLLGTAAIATACGGSHATSPTNQAEPSMAAMDTAHAAAWAARPGYTQVSQRTEEAYQYAMEHPLIVQWMPCYCGCGGIGHGSNLDCYFEPSAGGTIVFEEHASYCEICVDITLRTKQLANSGATLASIRTAIDAEFGGAGPGTDTERPL